jgi:hypothetical protein
MRIAAHTIWDHDYVAWGSNTGTSLKIGRDSSPQAPILQFEYTASDNLYFDLSNIDGAGPARTGSPFYWENVKLSPTGNGEGQGTCVKIRCRSGQVCVNAYQAPEDPNTKACPLSTGDMWLDLCQPDPQFSN